MNVSEMLGKTLLRVEETRGDEDHILFTCDDNTEYMMHHEQDCCEHVSIKEIIGDWSLLIGNPLLMAEEITNGPFEMGDDTDQWTFYKFATIKGSVTIDWIGYSNGYYSTSVNIHRGNQNE